MGSGRSVVTVDGDGGLCVSVFPTDPQGVTLSQEGQSTSCPSRSLVALCIMDKPSFGTCLRLSKSPATLGPSF